MGGNPMDRLKAVWAAILARFWNLYTLRAIAVVVLSLATPHIDPRLASALNRIVDALAGGDAGGAVLAVFGGGYVLADLLKARRKAMPEGGPDYSWVAK